MKVPPRVPIAAGINLNNLLITLFWVAAASMVSLIPLVLSPDIQLSTTGEAGLWMELGVKE